MTPESLARRLDDNAALVHADLEGRLARLSGPDRLKAAMRHAVLAGGKRIRPFLVMESARLFAVEGPAPLAVGAALECVHCYSLVHDDLPAMDDDDIRRGQPTVHRAFDEATAILAGDALLTLAFEIITEKASGLRPAQALKLVSALAIAAGESGMVGGQMLDLAAEGRFLGEGQRRRPMSRSAIRDIQARKTGALIRFAAEAGAFMTRSSRPAERRALKTFGDCLGLAFQIRDDLLDIEGEAAIVGKAVAKDRDAGKATYTSLIGLDGARLLLAETGARAKSALSEAFGSRGDTLAALINFNAERKK